MTEVAMKIKVEEKDEVTIVYIDGNVLQENVPLFRVKLLELLESDVTRIILDMLDCNYISSMCLAAIVDVKKKLTEKNGDVKITRVNKLVFNLLETTNLLKQIEVFDTIAAAIRSFKENKK
jgi:anti-anti-sigma factor